MGNWGKEFTHHVSLNGAPLTVKVSKNGNDALIARGHLTDIQPGEDHVHVWDLTSGDFHLHDMRVSPGLVQNIRDEGRGSRITSREDSQFESLIFQARQLAAGELDRSTLDKAKGLDREWRSLGRAAPAQHHQFRGLIDEVFAKNRERVEKAKQVRAENKIAKDRVVREAERAAESTDLRAASDRMRSLFDDWKQIGPCEKSDADQLWSRFQAARDKLRRRKEEEFSKRKAEWASNKMAKQRIVSQMSSLANSSDFRFAKDQARSISDQWRATGPCDKTDNDRLWAEFKGAKDRLFEAAKREGERRKAEVSQRTQEHIYRLEDQLRNVEAAIYRAEESYSRALNARSPSLKNPNWGSIVRDQQTRQSTARDKISSLSQRKGEILSKLMDARSRASRF